MNKAKELIELIQLHENAPHSVVKLKEGEESNEFWGLWGLRYRPEGAFEECKEWNYWY